MCIWPHIDFCVQVWNPYYAKDIDLLEKIQQRATKLVPELCNLPYEDQLKQLNIAIAIFSLLQKTEGRFDRGIQNLKKQYQVFFSHYHQ